MDFTPPNRSSQPQAAQAPAASASSGANRKTTNNNESRSKLARIGVVVGVALVVLLIVGVIASLLFSDNSNSKEASFVDSSKLQAVFLNTGQVYFGNVKQLNGSYFVLSNIYYLQTANAAANAQAANTSVSLVKLGCELHEPFDRMVINRDQVTFWENLQDGGQVAKAVSTFEKQNPNGQKCADQSNSSTNTSNAVQNAGTSATPSTTPTTSGAAGATTTNP